MKISGEYIFDAPPEKVWSGLMDPDVMVSTMPGAERLELVGENRYESALNIKVGPVQGSFRGRIELEDIDPPNGYSMKVSGQGAQGFVNATARIAIVAEGEKTRMKYDGDAQVGGRIASVGQRLMESSAKAVIKQSLDGLNATLQSKARADDEEGDEPSSPVSGLDTTTTKFAFHVAKDVTRDLIPKPVWIVGAILLVVVLYFLLG